MVRTNRARFGGDPGHVKKETFRRSQGAAARTVERKEKRHREERRRSRERAKKLSKQRGTFLLEKKL